MNARQKAKKYKKELDRLKLRLNKVYSIEITHREIRTLQANMSVSADTLARLNMTPEDIDEGYRNQLLTQITFDPALKNLVLFDKEVFPNMTTYMARLDIVVD